MFNKLVIKNLIAYFKGLKAKFKSFVIYWMV